MLITKENSFEVGGFYRQSYYVNHINYTPYRLLILDDDYL